MFWRTSILMLFLLPSSPLPASERPGHVAPTVGSVTLPDPTSPDEVFSQMQYSFRSDRAKGQHLRFQFNFSEPQGGKWWIEINDGNWTLGKGAISHPDTTFTCTGADWVRLSNGTLGGFQAVLTGRLHVGGNQFAAHKLDEIFP
jgi:putative sterol carrier protein